MYFIILIIEVFLLTISLSIDTFISGIAYGSNKIKVPLSSLILINSICSLILGISLFLGSFISKYVSYNLTLAICVSILIILGIIKIFDSYIKNLIKKHNGLDKNIKLNFFSMKITLHLYAAPEISDFDKSKILSLGEAIAIAIALSIDSITVGFGTGLMKISVFKIFLLIISTFIFGFISLITGCKIGNKIADKIDTNITWISGIILIALAIMKLFL